MACTTTSKKIIYIGRDYKGTLSNVQFDGVAGGAGAVVTWYLYDSTGDTLGTGTGTYVSSGLYTFIIDYLTFDEQRPVYPQKYLRGRLLVTISQSGADGSFGYDEVEFRYPGSLAS